MTLENKHCFISNWHGSNLALNLFEPQKYVYEFVSDADNKRTAQASGVIYTTKY